MAEFTQEELKAAARKALEAGNLESARRLLKAARAAQPQAPQETTLATTPDGGRVIQRADGSRMFVSPGMSTTDPVAINRIMEGATPAEASSSAGPVSSGGRGMSAIRSGLQGLTFQMGDEIVGRGASMVSGRDYETELARERRRLTQGEEEFPNTTLGSEIGGAVTTGLVTGAGPFSRAQTLGQRAAVGAGLGAAEGAAYEFGGGEGLDDRIDRARDGFVVGGLVGGAAPLAVSGVRAGLGRVADPVGGLLNIGNASRAQNAVVRAFDESGASADDIQRYLADAASEGQPEAVIADALGTSGQRALSGVARQPGPGRRIVTEFLDGRQNDQADRVSQFLKDALGGSDTAAVTQAQIAAQRQADARMAYGAATQNAAPVNVTEAVRSIDALLRRDPILGESSLKQGALGRRLQSFRDRMARGGEQVIDFDTVRGIRTDLREYFEQNPRARATFSDVYDKLTEALTRSSPEFRAANDGYRAASRVLEAVETGGKSNRPSVRADDVIANYSRMTPEEQAAFRVGYADSLLQKVENARPGQNVSDPLRSTRQRDVLGAVADNPDRLARQVEREADMFETRRIATGGSQTSGNLADQAAVNGQDLGVMGNLLQGRPMAAGGQFLGNILTGATGMNEGAREELARMMLSRDPQGLLDMIAAAQQSRASMAIADGGLRGAQRGSGTTDDVQGLMGLLAR